MDKLRVFDTFAGIGGFSLGLEATGGFETVSFCEIEEYPIKVLKKHWPDVPIYEDIKNVTAERLRSDGIGRIDVITGGFPCQDLSVAGNQAGIIDGERSSLWGELCRIIGDIRPRYAIVENVTALISGDNGRWFGKVLGDLAEIGYDCEWHCLLASRTVGACHERDRIYIIAYPNEEQFKWCAKKQILRKRSLQVKLSRKPSRFRKRSNLPESRFHRGGNGVSKEMDRIKALGNAVVPQIPELIGNAILEQLGEK